MLLYSIHVYVHVYDDLRGIPLEGPYNATVLDTRIRVLQ